MEIDWSLFPEPEYRDDSKDDPPSMPRNQCSLCKNSTHFGNCKAYPVGIPEDIYYDDFIHTKPYPGDNGIQFEAFES